MPKKTRQREEGKIDEPQKKGRRKEYRNTGIKNEGTKQGIKGRSKEEEMLILENV